MEDKEKENLEAKWPAVDLAYEFVRPSYDWVQRRLEAVDNRVQMLMAFAASITLAIPVLAVSAIEEPDFKSVWVFLALANFAVAVVVGAVARLWGGLILVSPKELYQKWLHYSEWEFNPNPPKDTDGRREESGRGVRELQGK